MAWRLLLCVAFVGGLGYPQWSQLESVFAGSDHNVTFEIDNVGCADDTVSLDYCTSSAYSACSSLAAEINAVDTGYNPVVAGDADAATVTVHNLSGCTKLKVNILSESEGTSCNHEPISWSVSANAVDPRHGDIGGVISID